MKDAGQKEVKLTAVLSHTWPKALLQVWTSSYFGLGVSMGQYSEYGIDLNQDPVILNSQQLPQNLFFLSAVSQKQSAGLFSSTLAPFVERRPRLPQE